MAGEVSELEVNVEDCATILIRLRSGAQADIHMDFAQRTASRSCVLAGDAARLEWVHAENQVRIIRSEGESLNSSGLSRPRSDSGKGNGWPAGRIASWASWAFLTFVW